MARSSRNPPPAETSEPGRVTLQHIAEAAGVTRMTVSRALRNQAKVSESLREKIRIIAEEMGYRPDPMLGALSRYRHNRVEKPIEASVAWLNFWPNPEQMRGHREFDLYWHGASRQAEKLGYRLDEFRVNEVPLSRLAKIFRARGIRGILLPPSRFPRLPEDVFAWDNFSIVRFGSSIINIPTHSVNSDQFGNTIIAFRKVVERGYRRIGFVGNAWRTRVFGGGFLWAQLEVPASQRLPLLLFEGGSFADREKQFLAWLKKHKPDAIITEEHTLPRMLARAGYRVPEDIGLAALSVLDCPIDSGINQNSEEVGRVSMLVLASLIQDRDQGMPPICRQILVAGSWVDGSSLSSLADRSASEKG